MVIGCDDSIFWVGRKTIHIVYAYLMLTCENHHELRRLHPAYQISGSLSTYITSKACGMYGSTICLPLPRRRGDILHYCGFPLGVCMCWHLWLFLPITGSFSHFDIVCKNFLTLLHLGFANIYISLRVKSWLSTFSDCDLHFKTTRGYIKPFMHNY